MHLAVFHSILASNRGKRKIGSRLLLLNGCITHENLLYLSGSTYLPDDGSRSNRYDVSVIHAHLWKHSVFENYSLHTQDCFPHFSYRTPHVATKSFPARAAF